MMILATTMRTPVPALQPMDPPRVIPVHLVKILGTGPQGYTQAGVRVPIQIIQGQDTATHAEMVGRTLSVNAGLEDDPFSRTESRRGDNISSGYYIIYHGF